MALVRMVMKLAPLFCGRWKLPAKVAPAGRTISSPGCAASIAACRSPPTATLIELPVVTVASILPAQLGDGGGGGGGGAGGDGLSTTGELSAGDGVGEGEGSLVGSGDGDGGTVTPEGLSGATVVELVVGALVVEG